MSGFEPEIIQGVVWVAFHHIAVQSGQDSNLRELFCHVGLT